MAGVIQDLNISHVSGIAILVLIIWCIYARYFHSLAKYPGSCLASCTNFWYVQRNWIAPLYLLLIERYDGRRFSTFFRGNQHLVDHELHQRYGSVVRDGPDSLLFADLDAYMAIYGFNRGFEKGDFYCMTRDPDPHKALIFSARTDDQHRKRRKAVAPSVCRKRATGLTC